MMKIATQIALHKLQALKYFLFAYLLHACPLHVLWRMVNYFALIACHQRTYHADIRHFKMETIYYVVYFHWNSYYL